ncbi:DNA-methyltransferase [Nonomuraea sp. NPDC050790]|uniref:DNA-methyltransferase n=1 Tax=Nonomuraea sp. NPDC050790 TaxID=3364371 RepID=UPI00379E796C
MRDGKAIVLRGDARDLPLPDNSVDLIVTSPPYWGLRDYRDGGNSLDGQIGAEPTPDAYIDALIDCTREWMRILTPEGSIFVVLGDKYSTHVGTTSGTRLARGNFGTSAGRNLAGVRDVVRAGIGADLPDKSRLMLPERYRLACAFTLGLIVRSVIIWSKPACMPESVTDRVRVVHEDIVHLTKQPRYFASVDDIRRPHKAPLRVAGNTAMQARNLHHPRTATSAYEGPHPLGALPGSVWEIATEPVRVPQTLGASHYAPFPLALVRTVVLGWSPDGGVVADPFGGTGTTALVASVLGRTGISVDRSADYCRIAQWRTTDPGERARAMGVPKPEPVHPQQSILDLFSEVSDGA